MKNRRIKPQSFFVAILILLASALISTSSMANNPHMDTMDCSIQMVCGACATPVLPDTTTPSHHNPFTCLWNTPNIPATENHLELPYHPPR